MFFVGITFRVGICLRFAHELNAFVLGGVATIISLS
jgi:hypothetical protein